ncbi:hypothetical protein [Butyricimonas synergistica]|uniref:hypothetical protein n=1 Tax=Butyricimonas synergistica TaxID=544644 RepID=UPI00036B5365|nr:hypothetical protein [Butyricimonas synergistica]
MKRNIYFRADASDTIGYGHFTRMLSLAGMLKDDFCCTFFTCHPTPYQVEEMRKVCPSVSLREDTHHDDFLSRLRGDEIVVLDNYFFTTAYQRRIKERGCKLVCVDDMHDKHYVADVVINHGVADVSLFDVEASTRLCLGLRWALLREPFLQPLGTSPKEHGDWFISFGGSDFHNLTSKFIRLIHDREEVKRVFVVVGDSYQHGDPSRGYDKVILHRNLPAIEMAALMQRSEYAILPSSGICIEALSRGCKIFAGYYVDNQERFYRYLNDNHHVHGLGNLLDPSLTMPEKFDLISMFDTSLMYGIKERYIQLFKNI